MNNDETKIEQNVEKENKMQKMIIQLKTDKNQTENVTVSYQENHRELYVELFCRWKMFVTGDPDTYEFESFKHFIAHLMNDHISYMDDWSSLEEYKQIAEEDASFFYEHAFIKRIMLLYGWRAGDYYDAMYQAKLLGKEDEIKALIYESLEEKAEYYRSLGHEVIWIQENQER